RGAALRPALLRQCPIPLQVGAGPGEAAAERGDLHPESTRRAGLPPIAALGFDELEHGNAQTLTRSAQEETESGGRLALAIAGVDDDQTLVAAIGPATMCSQRLALPLARFGAEGIGQGRLVCIVGHL